MGHMSTARRVEKKLSEQEIDQIVVAQAADESVWDEPVSVRRVQPAALSIPAGLAARAAFVARLHHTNSTEAWLTRIIEERVELEEAAFAGPKQDMARSG
jgi:fructose-1-phosphate kinase PfkB-like protein